MIDQIRLTGLINQIRFTGLINQIRLTGLIDQISFTGLIDQIRFTGLINQITLTGFRRKMCVQAKLLLAYRIRSVTSSVMKILDLLYGLFRRVFDAFLRIYSRSPERSSLQ